MKTFSQLIQGIVHTVFKELKEECDHTVDVNIATRKITITANNNTPLTLQLWSTSKIKHDIKGFKDYIKMEIQKELGKPSYASLYLACLGNRIAFSEVGLSMVNVKSFLDDNTFSFYATRAQFEFFEKLNISKIICDGDSVKEEFIKEQDWREGDTIHMEVIGKELVIRNLDWMKREGISNETP